MPLIKYFLTSSFMTTMSPVYDDTTHDGDLELQPPNPTTSLREHSQSKSGAESNDQSPASTISEFRRTRDSRAETIPETVTEMAYALGTLIKDFEKQSARLQSAASTREGEPRPIDHKVRNEVRDWLDTSLKVTRNCQPTFPTVSPTISRYLRARMKSREDDIRKNARLVRDEIRARETADGIMNKGNARAGRRQGDKAEIKAVIASWGGSV